MTNNLRRRQAGCLPGTSLGQKERGKRRGVAMGILVGVMAAGGLHADGEVSTISTSLKPATPFAYTAGGIEYQWGMGSNQIMESFTSDGRSFTYALAADRVEIQRHDIPGVATGEPCGIFVERLSDGDKTQQYAADYPSDGSGTGNCDLPAMLSSRVLNRGAVDLFSNQLPDAKNIERLDYIFDYGVLVPIASSMMDLAGHVASEKRSNNPVKMAAILSLDILGQPASYGPLIVIGASGCSSPALCYGVTDLQHEYSFLQNEYNAPQSFPVETERSFERVGMAFVSTAKLGLLPGQRYYGFSVFADDVDANLHDLLNPGTFPTDTADNEIVLGDDADIYGGLSGYFVADELSVTNGAVFNDINGDGIPNDNEAGISDVRITLYVDAIGNGMLDDGVDVQIGDTIDSDMSGNFVLPGLPDGHYIVEMDERDPDLPAGLVNAPGTNPHPVTIAGGDSDPVYFPFIDPNGNGNGGSTSGSTDSGNGDGGADGNTDSGIGDGGADGNTDSGNGDGGADGSTDSGSGDGGADGTSDSGNGDGGADGNTDSGNGDGGADGSTDSGSGDGGADGTSDSGNGDGGADGSTDSGSGDGGADGTSDSGNGDGGADGSTDSGSGDGGADGTSDSGNGDGGADGNTDSGSGDGGADGNTDSGNGDGGFNDGDTTDAVDDEFEVNQGRAGIFDVLANDVDGVGDDLTLISATQSPNATINVVNNQIDYRPNFGFYGTDTFLYTMQDGSGAQFSANVEVNVVRFSDLNDNGLNDFVECDCTDLTLQTGVNGSGVGSLSWFGAWVLLMGLGVRRMRGRKENSSERGSILMTVAKTRTNNSGWTVSMAAGSAILVAGMATVFSQGSGAEDFTQRLYLNGGIGVTEVEPESPSDALTISDKNDSGGHLGLGYDISRMFSVEAYAADLGTAEVEFLGAKAGSVDYQVFGVSLLGYLYNSRSGVALGDSDTNGLFRREGLSLYGRAGIGHILNDSNRVEYTRDYPNHAAFGLGLEYGFENGFALRTELMSMDTDAKYFNVGVLKRFGSVPIVAVPVVQPETVVAEVTKPEQPENPVVYNPITAPLVYFEFDKSEINPEDRQKLDAFAAEVQDSDSDLKISIEGHTDWIAGEQYNMSLSIRRAEAVFNYLVSKGLPAEGMTTIGYGETRPVSNNNTANGRALNRRTEIQLR